MSSQISTKANQDTQNTKLDTLHTDLAAIDGHVDGIETLVASTNTKLDTLHADVPALNVAQNSSTSGQNGPLVQTATTTAAPTYTTAKTNPLSTDTAGNLRVSNLTATPAGSAIIGKVAIDQTTPGTTNGVQVNAALPTGTNSIGQVTSNAGTNTSTVNLDVALSTRLKPADTLAGVTTVGTVTTVSALTAITNALPAGTNRLGTIRPVDSADADLTTVKGTQTSRAMGTQDLKDSGRVAVSFYALGVASGTTTTETAITMTKSAATGATSSASSFVVTSGKKFRIIQISVATRGNVTATAQVTTFSLRVNAAGAVTTSSTPIVFSARSATPATALAWDRVILPLPEGYEIAGDGTLQIGMTANSVFTTNAPTWDVNIIGYEY